MLLVPLADIDKGQEWEEDVEHMSKLAALLPGRDLRRVCLLIEIVDATVEPVTVAIDMKFFEVTELVLRMVLQVVSDDLVFLCGLRFVLKSISRHEAR